MSAIMKLRQARNVEQIAEELAPLATSLATLAEQAQTSIQAIEEASQRQAQQWSEKQEAAASELTAAAKTVANQVNALQLATASLKAAVEELHQERRSRIWGILAVVVLAAVVSSGLTRFLAPEPTYRIDAQAVAEHLKPAILEATRRK